MKIIAVGGQVLVEDGEGFFIPIGRWHIGLGDKHVPGEGPIEFLRGQPVNEADINRFVERWNGINESRRAEGVEQFFGGIMGEIVPEEITAEEAIQLLKADASREWRLKVGGY